MAGDQLALGIEGRAVLRQPPHLDGTTYEPAHDGARLGRQLIGVLAAMRDGRWWTLRELARVAGGSEAGVSARIRDLRKRRFGAHQVERQRVGRGLFRYRLLQASTDP